jgi:hypothetical protein
MGSTPGASYEAARAAFEQGDILGATSSAAAASATVAGAAALGGQRLAIGIGVATGLLILIVVLMLLGRRRGRRSAAAASAGAVVTEPYATLAADPDAAPPSTSERPSESEGGADQGDPPHSESPPIE